jgi:hypothetical protein
LNKPNADLLAVLRTNSVRDILFDQPTRSGPSKLEAAVAAAPEWRLLALKKRPDRTLSLYSMSTLYSAKE